MESPDIWAEAENRAAQWFDPIKAGPLRPETDALDRLLVATAAAQIFAEWYRRRGERLSEADARRLAEVSHASFRDGVGLNSPTTLRECLLRAMDPQRKDRAEYQKALDARLRDCMRDGHPIEPALRVWSEFQDKRPKHSREAPNYTRDTWIVHALSRLQDCGIDPTRNRDKTWQWRAYEDDYKAPLAGCAIVAAVFDIEYPAVEKVWRERDRVL